MARQEEIKEEVIEKYLAQAILLGARLMCGDREAGEEALKLAKQEIHELHSQGVVIKGRCPDCEWSQFVSGESVGMTPCHSCNSTGYLIEPLIEEVKD